MKFDTKIGSKAIGLGTVSALALVASIAWAAGGAGTLDASFGAGEEDGTPAGVVATSLGNGDDIAEDLSVGADGIVTVVGNRHNGESNDIVIVRYTAEGAFDAGFGVGEDDGTPNGVVNISLGEGNDFGTAIATQADGKVIVAGYHDEGASTNMVVLRVNTDGTLDDSFGTADDGTANGIVNISLGDGNDVARDVVLQADGKIVLVGDSVVADGSTNIIVARLNADGSVDDSFGQSEDGTPNGFVATSLGVVLRLIDAMSASAGQRVEIDQMAIRTSPAVRASFDLDGVRLVTASQGLRAAWPTFAKVGNSRLSDHLVNEASLFLHDTDFLKSARRGEVAVITAVSDRHIDLEMDTPFLHRWTAVFRAYGTAMHIDMSYEPCAPNTKKGVEQAVMFDDLASA